MDAYANQNIRLAIRGISNDGYMLMIDDLEILSQNSVNNNNNIQDIVSSILQGNYPNPFNPSTDIAFTLGKAGFVDLKVYNIKGQKIKELLNVQLLAGEHKITWNGDNDKGEKVPSGVYFCRLSIDNNAIQTKKMVLLK